VRASYSSRSDDRCKESPWLASVPGTLANQQIEPALPLTPAEKHRRITLLRAILRHAAPTFRARIDAGEQGARP
jgi:hypothetical protein